jgi:hypothetical protein
MKRYAWIVACLALLVAVLPNVLLAKRRFARRTTPVRTQPVTASVTVPQASQQPQPTPLQLKIDPHQAFADILRLRSEIGVQGDAVGDAGFEEALREIIAKEHGALEPVTPAAAALSAAPLRTSPVDALRQSAEHFDERAAELEAGKDYIAADAARDVAASLRREARRLDP